MKEEPRNSYSGLLVTFSVSRDVFAFPMKGNDKTATNVTVDSHLFQSSTASANIARVTPKISQLVKLADKNALEARTHSVLKQ